jgi:HAD superfamily hydrolase (TIGR01459 family)
MTPPILAAAGHILARHDVIFCDVWGVIHDGVHAFPKACEALIKFRDAGGTVVLVSNAPVPKARVAAMLASKGVPTSAYDDIVSSGDIALREVKRAGYRALHCIGPQDRDQALFSALGTTSAPLEHADAIICTGLDFDDVETAESYRSRLEVALARQLPFVCANPDLWVDVGGKLYLCAGAIADLYQHMGGPVYWAGKPHPSAYGTALIVAQEIRGTTLAPTQMLGIGDALRTDLKAASNAGVPAIFIAAGIHRHDTMVGETIDETKLAQLFHGHQTTAIAAMPYLAW